MIEHLTDVEIYEVAAGETVAAPVTAHASACAVCAGEIAAVRRVLGDVELIKDAVEIPTGLDRRLARRLDDIPVSRHPSATRRPGQSFRWLVGAAAAVLCFAAGAAFQAAWSSAETSTYADAESSTDVPHTLAVQRAGTSYVAAIAELTTDPTSDLRTGREVALSAMSGAAFELRRLAEGDPVVRQLHELVERARREAAVEMGP